jgi:NADPH:quinone reductase-like Zn-dependent oxidoreductase
VRAFRLAGGALVPAEIERSRAADGEAVVRVFAAGVTPTELDWYPTSHTKSGEPRSGAVPSHEFSGEVDGEAVFGMNDWFADGALAEYCVTRPEWIAPKPRTLSHVEAATVPISALTAWQGLHDRAKLRTGERVLVHGGAGSVGSFAVQLARRAGARVTATVSARNVDFVKSLGAERAIDYRTEQVTGEFDVVFDTVGNAPRGGRTVSIVEGSQDAPGFFIVEPKSSAADRSGGPDRRGGATDLCGCSGPVRSRAGRIHGPSGAEGPRQDRGRRG